jgi:hypothetical protein
MIIPAMHAADGTKKSPVGGFLNHPQGFPVLCAHPASDSKVRRIADHRLRSQATALFEILPEAGGLVIATQPPLRSGPHDLGALSLRLPNRGEPVPLCLVPSGTATGESSVCGKAINGFGILLADFAKGRRGGNPEVSLPTGEAAH